MPTSKTKRARYFLEFVLLRALFFAFGLLPAPAASAVGGFLGRTIGPRLGASKKAHANLRAALPGLPEDEYRRIVRGMWDNLGRVIGEYPHLEKLARARTEIVGGAVVDALRADGLPGLLFGGHLGNWEITAVAARASNLPLHGVFRAPNNPLVAQMLARARESGGLRGAIPKTRAGGRQMLKVLIEGGHVGILIDQKYNEGVPALFFGRPAMTSPAFAELALKFKCPLVPVRCERLPGARFRITVCDPLPLFGPDGEPLPVQEVIARAHAILEGWIRERPEQWLWLHRRWSARAQEEYRA